MATATKPNTAITNLKPPDDLRELIKWRKDLLGTMNPAMQRRCGQVESFLDEGHAITLKRAWTIGKMVREIQDNETKFGVMAMEKLMAWVGYDRRASLTLAAHFYKDFSNEKDLQELLKLRTKYSKRPIPWMFIQKILVIDDRQIRMQILRRICEEEMTHDQVDHLVDEYENRGPEGRHAGGRPPLPPRSMSGRLSRLERHAHNIVRDAEAIYQHPDFGFLPSVKELAPDQVSPALIQAIDRDLRLVAQLNLISTALQTELTEARAIAVERSAEHARKLADRNKDVADAEATPVRPTPRLEHKKDADKPKKGDKAHTGNGATKKRGAQTPVGVS